MGADAKGNGSVRPLSLDGKGAASAGGRACPSSHLTSTAAVCGPSFIVIPALIKTSEATSSPPGSSSTHVCGCSRPVAPRRPSGLHVSRSQLAPSSRAGGKAALCFRLWRHQRAAPAAPASNNPPHMMASRLNPANQPPPAAPTPTTPAPASTGQSNGATSGAQQAAQAATALPTANFLVTIQTSCFLFWTVSNS